MIGRGWPRNPLKSMGSRAGREIRYGSVPEFVGRVSDGKEAFVRERLRNPEYAHGRRWYALIVLCLTLTIIGIDNSILNVALPTLARSTGQGGLGASASELQWIVDVYVLVFAGLLLTAGALGDRFGRLRFLNIGLALFGAGSIVAASASSAGVLIGARALMGVGAACIMPATLSLITNIFTDPHERAKAIGAWAGVAAVGVGLGPLLGGLLIEHFSWGAVFLVNMPVVITALVLGFFLVPESRDPSAPKLDPLGSLLSILGLVSLVWAIIEGPSNGWTSTTVLGAFALAVVMLGLFFVWELRCANPMLDLRFFENRRFSAASAAITLTYLALFGVVFLFTQYLQLVLGYSAVEAGAAMVPMAATMVVFAPRSPKLVRRFGTKRVVAGGMVLSASAALLMTLFQVDSPLWLVVAITLPLGLGLSNVMAPSTESIMGSLPRAKAGVGSAMNDTTRQVGGALGVALLGSIVSSLFGSKMHSALSGSVGAGVLARAEDSLGAALGVARTAPHAQAARIAAAAKESFVSSMHVSMFVAFAILVVGVIVVLLWLPARASDAGVEHATAADMLPAGITGVDVLPGEAIADFTEEREYEREYQREHR
jgi:EmrB/QacA subfamily drug resistance transporter